MSNIEIKSDGKIIESKEIEGNEYFSKLETELQKVNADIEFLQNIKSKIEEKLFLKEEFQKVQTENQTEKAKVQGKIIGNVTDNGSKKIFHLPKDEGYDSVEYDKERGDMLFDSEEEAIEAGFEMKVKKQESVDEADQKE